jgi:outer membrane receptor for Fe3+-dicitrate
MKRYFYIILFFISNISSFAGILQGVVKDSRSGEALVGTTITVVGTQIITTSGLDGSYKFKNIPSGRYTLACNYISYNTEYKEIEITSSDKSHIVDISLSSKELEIGEILVVGKTNRTTDTNARLLEHTAPSIVNVVSAHAIETSPDLTVANVVQRVSGVSVERSSTGDGQYAILRGMDKRYNYTLVNGIKIPSPDNKNRYIPLDIFPADMLDQLIVTKALTPRMEGDAVGGVVNMVMKDAPDKFMLSANLAIGYSQMFFNNPFTTFDWTVINRLTPFETHGENSNYQAQSSEFTTKNLHLFTKSFVPNINAGLTLGNRFLDKKLGIMISASYQQNNRGNNSTRFSVGAPQIAPVGLITGMSNYSISEEQMRTGILAKADYRFDKNNQLEWNNIFVNLKNIQYRHTSSPGLAQTGNSIQQGSESFRMRYTDQLIYSSSLQGKHSFNDHFSADWTGAFALAQKFTPDNTSISLHTESLNGVPQPEYITFGNDPAFSRRWEHNSDQDLSGYLNLKYITTLWKAPIEINVGGLYRNKNRDNFYNEYYMWKETPPHVWYLGTDFTDFSLMKLDVFNPQGSSSNPLTYGAHEYIGAGYLEINANLGQLQIVGGVRAENTDQGYKIKYQSPIASLRIPNGSSIYTDVLPSINFKYKLGANQNLRASYFRSINRPGYFEMVPYSIVNDIYQEKGNPDLKRAIIDNIDFRYELFPQPENQAMIGVFYKKIQDPIEYAMMRPANGSSLDLFYMPGNFGTAYNYGAEFDFVKYFHSIGIKANYTYTNSSITTPKTAWVNEVFTQVNQKRPLYGQSAHVANLSLLYKDVKNGWNAQFAVSYTGDRISYVSQYLNNDLWQKGYLQGDFSIEKRIKKLTIYVKANNLFNTKMIEFIKLGDNINAGFPMQDPKSGETIINQEFYGQTFLLGVRYKL